MEYRTLGHTGFKVSRLCFGTLTIGPLQARLSLPEGTAVLKAALTAGVNFFDTAELYQNYDYIRAALQGHENSVYICSKSYAYTYEGMQKSVEDACHAIGRDYIDIFMMHEQVSRLTMKGHKEALRYLVAAKQAGIVRAIGVSTHTVEVVRAAALYDEIDVIHPILNMKGIGICDGSIADMQAAIAFATDLGKGIYTMKALGGGHLSSSAAAAFYWIRQQKGIDSVAVGMQSSAEVAVNCAVFDGLQPNPEDVLRVCSKPRNLLVEDWCVGCGHCVENCPMGAMQVIVGRAVPDMRKCVLCGYCGAHCPEFCIKVI